MIRLKLTSKVKQRSQREIIQAWAFVVVVFVFSSFFCEIQDVQSSEPSVCLMVVAEEWVGRLAGSEYWKMRATWL